MKTRQIIAAGVAGAIGLTAAGIGVASAAQDDSEQTSTTASGASGATGTTGTTEQAGKAGREGRGGPGGKMGGERAEDLAAVVADPSCIRIDETHRVDARCCSDKIGMDEPRCSAIGGLEECAGISHRIERIGGEDLGIADIDTGGERVQPFEPDIGLCGKESGGKKKG